MNETKKRAGCGRRVVQGHNETDICGKESYNGIFVCDGCKVKWLEEALGLQKIALDHKTTLLESCETALQERDESIVLLRELVESVIQGEWDEYGYETSYVLELKDKLKEIKESK